MSIPLRQNVRAALLLSVTLACQPALAGAGKVLDVVLGEGGTLSGRLLDSDSQPLSHQVVNVGHGQQATAFVTDKNGNFSVSGLQGGSYDFTAADGGRQTYRLWAHATQPPAAKTDTLDLFAEAKGKSGKGNGKPDKPDKAAKQCRLSPSHPRYDPDADCPPASP